MHISEGVLSPAVWGAGLVLAAAGTCLGLRKASYARLTAAAVLAAVFFVASLARVPVGLGSAHLVLNGLLGLTLGWSAFPALLIALLLQAVLFRYGGIAVLGVNTFALAMPAVLCHYIFRSLLNKSGMARIAAAFCCGALSVAGAAICAAFALGLSDEGFWISAKILLLAHIPVMLLEGCIAAAAISFIARRRPDLLHSVGQCRY